MAAVGTRGDTVVVEGLTGLTRAFKQADVVLVKELRGTLRKVAEPVRAEAERLAVERISMIGIPWSRMRTGVTTTAVYVAPRKRGTQVASRRRPNLADLLLNKAMLPSLHENEEKVVEGFDDMLGHVAKAWQVA